ESHGPCVVLARNRGVDTTKRSDGFDGIVGAEGDGHACVKIRLPRVRGGSALLADAVLYPAHVSEEMIGLNGGNDVKKIIFANLFWLDDLIMLYTETTIRLHVALRVSFF